MPSSHPVRLPSLALRIVVLTLPILLIFTVTALAATGLAAWWNGGDVLERHNLFVGILCGLVVWAFVTVFHIKRESQWLPIHGRGSFLDRARTQLEQLGYEISAQTDDYLVGTPSFHALLFGGTIEVRIEGRTATLAGPKVYVERLRKNLRIQSQVDQVQKSVRDTQRRQGEVLLKRVQISLRVPRKLWDDVSDEVISVLSAEDAEVVCEVNILAQSDRGVRDSAVEQLIRPWLEKHGLAAEIVKEDVERTPAAEPAGTAGGPG